MTDPVQVVAEALHDECTRRMAAGLAQSFPPVERIAETVVVALRAAGALMPEEAEAMRAEIARHHRDFARWESTAEKYQQRALAAEALLQEVREVLERHHLSPHHSRKCCELSMEDWPCPEAPLLHKIDQSAPRPSPAPSSHGGAGVGEAEV